MTGVPTNRIVKRIAEKGKSLDLFSVVSVDTYVKVKMHPAERNFFSKSNVVSVYLVISLCCLVSANVPHRRFEYKYSFKPPYLAQKDGTVPFWEYDGSEY